MPNNIQKILNDFLEDVKTILDSRLKKIFLYGSYARGDYNKSSDIDIMILTDLTDDEISKYSINNKETLPIFFNTNHPPNSLF